MATPPADDRVVHAISRRDWEAAGDEIRPASLEDEGFVHLSTPAQIAAVCTALYADVHDLVLLVVDPARLPHDLVWEDCYDAGQAFPHHYGPIPTSAVTAVVDYAPPPDGTFGPPTLPPP